MRQIHRLYRYFEDSKAQKSSPTYSCLAPKLAVLFAVTTHLVLEPISYCSFGATIVKIHLLYWVGEMLCLSWATRPSLLHYKVIFIDYISALWLFAFRRSDQALKYLVEKSLRINQLLLYGQKNMEILVNGRTNVREGGGGGDSSSF